MSVSDVAFSAIHDDAAAVLRVTGEVDEVSAPSLRESLATHSADFTAPLVVDLTGVSYLPSAAIGVLVSARHRAAANGGTIDLVAGEGSIAQRVLSVCALPHRSS